MRLRPDYVARQLEREAAGESLPGGHDEWPDPVGTVMLACGHAGVKTVQHVTREDAYWCPEHKDYFEPKGE